MTINIEKVLNIFLGDWMKVKEPILVDKVYNMVGVSVAGFAGEEGAKG